MLREAGMAGIAARLVTLGVAYAVSLPIGFGILLSIDPVLSVIVGGIMLSGVIGYYRISMSTANARAIAVRFARDAGRERKALAERTLKCQAPLHWDDTELSRFYRDGATAKVARALEQQWNAIERSTLLSNLVVAGSLVAIFMIGGLSAIDRGTGWEALLIFLLVLRQIGGRLVATMRIFIALNRYYPGLKRYAESIKQLDGMKVHAIPKKPGNGIQIDCSNGAHVTLKAGEIVSLIQTRPLERADALRLSRQSLALTEPDRPARFALLATGPVKSLSSLREAFDLRDEVAADELTTELRNIGGEEIANMMPADLDAPFDGRTGNRLPLELPLFVNLLSAIEHGYDGVLIDGNSLRSLNPTLRKTFFDAAQSARIVTILVGARLFRGEKGLISQILVSNGEHVTA
ncbi:MAG: hypothetical protein ACREXT_17190, partial [Gammaproteobacteria bacterium]